MSTVANPHIPLSTPIPGGFTHGKLIRIHGSTHHSPDRFDINLQCGPRMHHDDIALHVNPRFHQHTVVRNSLLSGSWGPEDTHQQHFPFHAGQSFELLLLADSNHYKVAVNGHHFAEFHFRTAPERVSHLTINGDVMISMVTFEGQSHGAPGMVPPGQLPPLGLVAPAMPSPHLTPVGPVPGHMPHPPMPAPGAPIGYPQQYPSQYPPGSKKAMKQQRKAQKKALKYGLPIAGAAGGAYLLHKGVKHASHGFHFGSSSSSSSSSSSEEE